MSNNVFRTKQRDLDSQEKGFVDSIKVKAAELWDLMDEAKLIKSGAGNKGCADQIEEGQKRLEESIMWAVKGITG